MKNISLTLLSMMFSETWCAEVFQCQCERAMPIRCLSSHQARVCLYMPPQTSQWRWKISKSRGYASLGGFILNKRNVKNEEEKAAELAADFGSSVIAKIDRSELVSEAEDMHKTVMEAFPDSTAAEQYKALADKIAELCGVGEEK